MSDPLWRAVFGRDAPVEVEIGPGRGETLLAFAREAPDVDFFGIEWSAGAAARIMARAARHGLSNIRVIGTDARWVVRRIVPTGSVAAYHVYFPDPWPKTRHRRRRLLDGPRVVRGLARSLAPGGHVHLATDLPALYASMARMLEAGGFALDLDAPRRVRPVTRFERKYARAGTHEGAFVRPARIGP